MGNVLKQHLDSALMYLLNTYIHFRLKFSIPVIKGYVLTSTKFEETRWHMCEIKNKLAVCGLLSEQVEVCILNSLQNATSTTFGRTFSFFY